MRLHPTFIHPLVAAVVAAWPALHPARAADAVDPSTLTGKLIMGYQGWFTCPDDGAGRGWFHWSAGGKPTTDMLPDVTDLPQAEHCPTRMTTAAGQPIDLFSSQNPATVGHHFTWMAQYGLDGVALQRFATHLLNPIALKAADHVLDNVRHAAEDHGRVFFVMYDLSGMPPDKLPEVVRDWTRLARELARDPAYLRHRGSMLLGLWGMGFAHRPMTPADATRLLDALARVSGLEGVTILGGVPAGWRTGTGDASPDPGWRDVWPRLAVISPWTVGRYVDDAGADAWRTKALEPDLAEAHRIGADYMPVVFPGFSMANLLRTRHAPVRASADAPPGAITNQIPRRCGRFYWRQVFNALSAGATMIYGAMFDEVDEATAMFKTLPSAAQAPVGGVAPDSAFVTLDEEGCRLPSDWYLRLAGQATQALRRHCVPAADLPLRPPL